MAFTASKRGRLRHHRTHCVPSPNAYRRNVSLYIPKDVPVAQKVDEQQVVPERDRSDIAALRYANEARKSLIGPMPIKHFFHAFFPADQTNTMPDARGAFMSVPLEASRTEDIGLPLIDAIEKCGRCPSVNFLDTSCTPSTSNREPDITGYSPTDIGFLERNKNGKIAANLGLAEIFFQVLVDNDPFCDVHDHGAPSEGDSERSLLTYQNYKSLYRKPARRALRNLGYMVAYVTEACARQHRAFYFSVLIVGTRARFFRWDRAGTIVTEAFDYRRQPKLLCEFLWRFHLSSPAQRGFDPTVTIASPNEERLFKRLISDEVAFQLNIDPNNKEKLHKALKQHYQEGKVSRVKAYTGLESQAEEYLVSVPVRSPTSVMGSCTRGYWSVRLGSETGEVAFLKDTWRSEFTNENDEGTIYEEIQGKVVNIPELHGHGLVMSEQGGGTTYPSRGDCSSSHRDEDHAAGPDWTCIPQGTRTQEFAEADWVCACLRINHTDAPDDGPHLLTERVHYRLVLNEVGYPLSDFTGSRELFDGANDAFEALESAYEKCRRLHRDVSLGNIVLSRCRHTNRRRGRLIDWELSTIVDTDGKASDHYRTGTWAFMSVLALDTLKPGFRHAKEDDTESLFYVVLYAILRWLPHEEKLNLSRWMYDFFDDSTDYAGPVCGGYTKRDYVADYGETFDRLFRFRIPAVQKWIRQVFNLVGTQYSSSEDYPVESRLCFDELRKLFEIVRKDLSTSDGVDEDRVIRAIRRCYDSGVERLHVEDDCSTCIPVLTFSEDVDNPPGDRKRKSNPSSINDHCGGDERSAPGQQRRAKRKRADEQPGCQDVANLTARMSGSKTRTRKRNPPSGSSERKNTARNKTSSKNRQSATARRSQSSRSTPDKVPFGARRSTRLARLPRPVYAL